MNLKPLPSSTSIRNRPVGPVICPDPRTQSYQLLTGRILDVLKKHGWPTDDVAWRTDVSEEVAVAHARQLEKDLGPLLAKNGIQIEFKAFRSYFSPPLGNFLVMRFKIDPERATPEMKELVEAFEKNELQRHRDAIQKQFAEGKLEAEVPVNLDTYSIETYIPFVRSTIAPELKCDGITLHTVRQNLGRPPPFAFVWRKLSTELGQG